MLYRKNAEEHWRLYIRPDQIYQISYLWDR
jgi:hypothetical protein